MTRNLQAALEYVKLGWPVFPVHSVRGSDCSCGNSKCGSVGKHPITPNGFHDATLDAAQVERWWTETPWANVGVPAGTQSGFVALDIDPRHGGDESLKQLLNGHTLPVTVTAETGGGGLHFLFASNEPIVTRKLGPGVDLRASGSYIVVPFSRHLSGNCYLWRKGHSPLSKKLAPFPAWLGTTVLAPTEPHDPAAPYADGSRNKSLFADACAMRRRGFDEEAIYQALIVQDRAKCNPPIGDDRELRLIAKSACRYEPETSDLGPGEIGITTDIQPGNPFERSLLNFQGILDADVGRVDYVIDPLFPKGNLTLIAAEWKTGKTIILYRLCLDLIFGKPGLGVLPIPHPHRVGIFQLEMPSTEDLRRFRKLALGMGLDPARVLALAEAGNLSHYSLPLVSLREERGRHWFHKTILDKGIDVVVVDSLIAGFAPADLNENSIVRALIHETFSPLLKEGITCVGLHHFRKPQATDKLMGNKTQALKSAVLGGIQFGAAAGRTYGLERLGRSPIDDEGTAVDFTCRLTSLGSWTPTNVEMILSIEETDNGGTSVAILEEGDQIRHGGVTTIQQAALALSRFVKEKGRVSRQDALVHVQNECNVSERTAERGEAEAKARDWVAVAENADDKKKRDLVPGLMA